MNILKSTNCDGLSEIKAYSGPEKGLDKSLGIVDLGGGSE